MVSLLKSLIHGIIAQSIVFPVDCESIKNMIHGTIAQSIVFPVACESIKMCDS